ncbi:hypothetical protein BVRB_4g077880 isoform A [Beta vulgaris subsp. vulgaris]|nr:hypothetical protein BVRB_4g077880 isoform A [Beta vulgaris subsp. vulgaris]
MLSFISIQFIFTTFIFFLTFPLLKSEDTNYAACSIPYSCGNITVGYPFWGDNRPKFCGIPDLRLKCSSDVKVHTMIDLINNGYGVPFRVLAINLSSNTIVVSRNKLFEHCHLKESNITFISTFKPAASYRNIILYYGCGNGCGSKSLNCTNSDSTIGSAYYFDKPSDMSRNCSCSNNVTFPVYERGLDELRSTKNGSIYSILTKWPIQMMYKANFTACSECQKSGGRCGSTEDPYSDQFMCYCSDGSKQSVCSKSGGGRRLLLELGAAMLGLGTTMCVFWIISARKRRTTGYCFEGNKRALIFEFLPNGSLEKFMYGRQIGSTLQWDIVFDIAIGIAKGLDYLHRGCNTHVYSYGMMLIDLVCGREKHVVDDQFCSDMYFPEWIYNRLDGLEEGAVQEILNDANKELEKKLILVSLWCIQTYPSNRPPMHKVVEMLEGPLELLQNPPKPHLSSPARCEFDSSSLITT